MSLGLPPYLLSLLDMYAYVSYVDDVVSEADDGDSGK